MRHTVNVITSGTVRRFPRTTEEAWGDYNRSTSCPIEPMGEARESRARYWQDRIIAALGVVAAVVIVYFA